MDHLENIDDTRVSDLLRTFQYPRQTLPAHLHQYPAHPVESLQFLVALSQCACESLTIGFSKSHLIIEVPRKN